MRALCIHLNEATSMFQLSRDPRTFFALDQAIDTSLLLGTFVEVVSISWFLR
jgi:hypothetical protein